ncbi:MAG: hypothetical protein HYS08_02985 [Chlamydiae bacterium]|nr:hypothetical protein [Chlamydiota bacterium]
MRRFRALKWERCLLDQRDSYNRSWNPDVASAWQLVRFNRIWQAVCQDIPYYRRLRCENHLPLEFSDWKEFRERVPVLERRTVKEQVHALIGRASSIRSWKSTGGSTAEPIRIPIGRLEVSTAAEDLWFARAWYGVGPSDKLFLIWGHSHLLGKGWRGWLKGVKRRWVDALLGYYRYSAYDLSEDALDRAAEALLKFQPAYVVGYSVALDRFVCVNSGKRTLFHELGLKAAIATGESFPRSDSAERITDILGCPVAMEYGSVETGPIAFQKPNGKYFVFWRHYLVEAQVSQSIPDAYEVLVTSLYPRCMPLIRYKMGDLIMGGSEDDHFRFEFQSVVGRCNDYVILEDGQVVHSEAFTHVIRDFSAISGYQILQRTDGNVFLSYTGARLLTLAELRELKRRLCWINAGLAAVQIERVQSIDPTIAGKTRRIIREDLSENFKRAVLC